MLIAAKLDPLPHSGFHPVARGDKGKLSISISLFVKIFLKKQCLKELAMLHTPAHLLHFHPNFLLLDETLALVSVLLYWNTTDPSSHLYLYVSSKKQTQSESNPWPPVIDLYIKAFYN